MRNAFTLVDHSYALELFPDLYYYQDLPGVFHFTLKRVFGLGHPDSSRISDIWSTAECQPRPTLHEMPG